MDKSADHLHLGQKAAAWNNVAKEFNAAFPVSLSKSTQQLKRAWEYIRNRVKKTNSSYIRKCHETSGGPCPTPPKLDELTLLAESVMQNDLQPALEQLDSVDVESGLEGINCTVGTDGTLQFEASDGGTKSLKKKLKRKVGPSTSKCSVEVDPPVVTKKRKLSQHRSFHQLPESAKEVMDSDLFEFIEVTKHCSDYNMLEEERMRVKVEDCSDNKKLEDGRKKVKVEQCNDKEKLEDERMKVKIEDCSDDKFEEERMKAKVEDCSDYDMLEEERMKVKIEDCTDEDVIEKVEHDIDEDDESKRVKDKDRKFKSKIKVTGAGHPPTFPKTVEEIVRVTSMMAKDLAKGNDMFETFTVVPVNDSSAADVYELQEEEEEMATEPPMKSMRIPRFSEAEMLTIAQGVEQRADTLFGKLTNNNTAAMKNAAWEMVAAEVNSVSRVRPSAEEVRRKVQDMRAQVKSKAAAETKYLQGTGGGPESEVQYSEWEQVILRLISPTSNSGLPLPESQIFSSNSAMAQEMDPLPSTYTGNTERAQPRSRASSVSEMSRPHSRATSVSEMSRPHSRASSAPEVSRPHSCASSSGVCDLDDESQSLHFADADTAVLIVGDEEQTMNIVNVPAEDSNIRTLEGTSVTSRAGPSTSAGAQATTERRHGNTSSRKAGGGNAFYM
ncbi:hypothetical protein Pcinc_006325 [Petrolisthes cinctipes]|uniref:Regulatory protein zeste n=1 Tax=Petrolisthes cinctipes TaxID=88211 RepID=A0AAE1KZR5_PETCI|nr:hypothetical protein Pcinc_006325 [Petrolisthes cinctipes]